MTTYSEYVTKAKSLRNDPMVESWIAERKKKVLTPPTLGRDIDPDCKHCGFPHDSFFLCNQAPFGSVRFGGRHYSIDLSNVVWWVEFMQSHVPVGAFHWRDNKYFRFTSDGVEITFFVAYNNTPQQMVWVIPLNEWQSIIDAVRPR